MLCRRLCCWCGRQTDARRGLPGRLWCSARVSGRLCPSICPQRSGFSLCFPHILVFMQKRAILHEP